jgi:hypothetical protein
MIDSPVVPVSGTPELDLLPLQQMAMSCSQYKQIVFTLLHDFRLDFGGSYLTGG